VRDAASHQRVSLIDRSAADRNQPRTERSRQWRGRLRDIKAIVEPVQLKQIGAKSGTILGEGEACVAIAG
jgi:hypothetical protein